MQKTRSSECEHSKLLPQALIEREFLTQTFEVFTLFYKEDEDKD